MLFAKGPGVGGGCAEFSVCLVILSITSSVESCNKTLFAFSLVSFYVVRFFNYVFLCCSVFRLGVIQPCSVFHLY